MISPERATNGISTRAEGALAHCGTRSSGFEISYSCQGPACSTLSSDSQDIVCHRDGASTLICSNDVKCQPGTATYQSNFTFSQNEPDPWSPAMENKPDVWVPQDQHVMVGACARFSLSSDGTKEGTHITGSDHSCPAVQKSSTLRGQMPISKGQPRVGTTQRPLVFTGTGSRRSISIPSLLFILSFAAILLLPGAQALIYHHSFGKTHPKIIPHARATVDGLQGFAEKVILTLTEKVNGQGANGEAFANRLVADVVLSVCKNHFEGASPEPFEPQVLQNCVTSVYNREDIPLPALQFLAIFEGSLLCNYVVSATYPNGQMFLPDTCDESRWLVDKVQLDVATANPPLPTAAALSDSRIDSMGVFLPVQSTASDEGSIQPFLAPSQPEPMLFDTTASRNLEPDTAAKLSSTSSLLSYSHMMTPPPRVDDSATSAAPAVSDSMELPDSMSTTRPISVVSLYQSSAPSKPSDYPPRSTQKNTTGDAPATTSQTQASFTSPHFVNSLNLKPSIGKQADTIELKGSELNLETIEDLSRPMDTTTAPVKIDMSRLDQLSLTGAMNVASESSSLAPLEADTTRALVLPFTSTLIHDALTFEATPLRSGTMKGQEAGATKLDGVNLALISSSAAITSIDMDDKESPSTEILASESASASQRSVRQSTSSSKSMSFSLAVASFLRPVSVASDRSTSTRAVDISSLALDRPTTFTITSSAYRASDLSTSKLTLLASITEPVSGVGAVLDDASQSTAISTSAHRSIGIPAGSSSQRSQLTNESTGKIPNTASTEIHSLFLPVATVSASMTLMADSTSNLENQTPPSTMSPAAFIGSSEPAPGALVSNSKTMTVSSRSAVLSTGSAAAITASPTITTLLNTSGNRPSRSASISAKLPFKPSVSAILQFGSSTSVLRSVRVEVSTIITSASSTPAAVSSGFLRPYSSPDRVALSSTTSMSSEALIQTKSLASLSISSVTLGPNHFFSSPDTFTPRTTVPFIVLLSATSIWPSSAKSNIATLTQSLLTDNLPTLPPMASIGPPIGTYATSIPSTELIWTTSCSRNSIAPNFCPGIGCVSLMTNKAHCGACDQACTHECHRGRCLCPGLTSPNANDGCDDRSVLLHCVNGHYTLNGNRVCAPAGWPSTSSEFALASKQPSTISPSVLSIGAVKSTESPVLSAAVASVDKESSESNICPPGLPDVCDGVCFNTKVEHNHCGGCGNFCSGTCVVGNCLASSTRPTSQLASTAQLVTTDSLAVASLARPIFGATAKPAVAYIWRGLAGPQQA